ncbi:hypothetical protein QQP08_002998 [Theobroma cacao]|nr:hypothetical protein QQP08_002998 [Theobroma cacao]
MEAASLISSSCFTVSSLPSTLCPQNLHHRGLFPLAVNSQGCRIAVVRKNLSFWGVKLGKGLYRRYRHCWRVCGLDSESASDRMMMQQACGRISSYYNKVEDKNPRVE